jgi:hypothetical protein
MPVKLLSGKTAKTRAIMPYELYVVSDDETVTVDGATYPLCCNVTDPDVLRESKCGERTGVWANRRVTLGFNTTSFDEQMEEQYSIRFES